MLLPQGFEVNLVEGNFARGFNHPDVERGFSPYWFALNLKVVVDDGILHQSGILCFGDLSDLLPVGSRGDDRIGRT